jgi:hypothetical protein
VFSGFGCPESGVRPFPNEGAFGPCERPEDVKPQLAATGGVDALPQVGKVGLPTSCDPYVLFVDEPAYAQSIR